MDRPPSHLTAEQKKEFSKMYAEIEEAKKRCDTKLMEVLELRRSGPEHLAQLTQRELRANLQRLTDAPMSMEPSTSGPALDVPGTTMRMAQAKTAYEEAAAKAEQLKREIDEAEQLGRRYGDFTRTALEFVMQTPSDGGRSPLKPKQFP